MTLLEISHAIFEKLHGEARPAHLVVNCSKTALQTAVMWLIFLGLGPFIVWQIETWLGLARWRFSFANQVALGYYLVFQRRVVGVDKCLFFSVARAGHAVAIRCAAPFCYRRPVSLCA